MSRCTIVQSHPVPDSYNAAVTSALTDGLTSIGRTPIVHRLAAGDTGPGQVDGELFLVFPTWWGGLPSPMLDWVQTTLGPWIDDGRSDPSPWSGVTRLHCLTTYGSDRKNNLIQGVPGQHLMRRTVRRLCARDVDYAWRPLYGMDTINDDGLAAHLERVRRSPLGD